MQDSFGKHEHLLPIARSFSLPLGRLPLRRALYKETVGSTLRGVGEPEAKLPSYPLEYMPLRDVVSTRRSPGLRPRWCPGYSPPIASRTAAFRHAPSRQLSSRTAGLSNDHNYTYFGAPYRACILASSGFRLLLRGLPADSATALLAKL